MEKMEAATVAGRGDDAVGAGSRHSRLARGRGRSMAHQTAFSRLCPHVSESDTCFRVLTDFPYACLSFAHSIFVRYPVRLSSLNAHRCIERSIFIQCQVFERACNRVVQLLCNEHIYIVAHTYLWVLIYLPKSLSTRRI